jgi:hypothetical protein
MGAIALDSEVKKGELDGVVEELGAIAEDARRAFGRLSAAQLNWKPSPERWSVGQCLDHLVKTNECFMPDMGRIAAGTYRTSAWGRVSPLSGLFARLILKALDPEKGRKTKAPKVFVPASSDIPADMVERFARHQKEFAAGVRATAGADPRRTIVTSPVAAVATYSLLDAYRIVVAHERKHLAQARRVTETQGFPRA